MANMNSFLEVYKELSECPMFMGRFDAKNGDDDFMYGIATVMEYIACKASDETLLEFQNTFFKNFEKSVDNAKIKQYNSFIK